MDDLNPIIYFIFIVIYFVSRAYRNAKKQQGQSPAQPLPEKKTESLFDTIREEVKKQVELEKARQEKMKRSEPQPPAPERKAFKEKAKKIAGSSPEIPEPATALDFIGEEGASAFTENKKQMSLTEEPESSPAFEFDPREAFMLKTLLERHPMVE